MTLHQQPLRPLCGLLLLIGAPILLALSGCLFSTAAYAEGVSCPPGSAPDWYAIGGWAWTPAGQNFTAGNENPCSGQHFSSPEAAVRITHMKWQGFSSLASRQTGSKATALQAGSMFNASLQDFMYRKLRLTIWDVTPAVLLSKESSIHLSP